jgi:hypothetical protein
LPEALRANFKSPVPVKARFAAVPELVLVSEITFPLAVAFTGDPGTFKAATKPLTTALAVAPAA